LLAAADGVLMVHYGRKTLAEEGEGRGPGEPEEEADRVPVLTY
jgi:hypothetical protein